MADTNLDRLKALLAELFMLDHADLDFGIYRVMNAKRGEIIRFLENDLLPQVRTALATVETGDRATLEAEKAKAIAAAQGIGLTREQAEQTPKVKELQAKIDAHANPAELENEVLSDLTNFFRRYYQDGDFLALRRYKAGVYAIPYEGEEVKLHWANADQYYIKTSEYLRDYTFKVPDGRRVHFKLIEADTEADNKKAASGQERRFILSANDSLEEINGELVIRFEYRPDPEKRKQSDLNALAAETMFKASGFTAWKTALAARTPTEKNPDRTILDKHLADYTARNTFDYFIHKDIGGFLRRELDFFIKNEIMHLDDIESDSAPRVEQYLAKIKAIRIIARKIIDFLEQLENFQKKLWLKKKFVVETNWCVTLDRVAEILYPEIAANDAQRSEWVELFAIDEIKANASATAVPTARQGELIAATNANFNTQRPAYSVPLTVDFLKANPFLVLDTKFFSEEFKVKLISDSKILGGAATLDEATDGLLIHSENFQALNLMQASFRERVKCIYIDPPYNTASSSIPYKNNYKHSSWAALMRDRLALLRPIMSNDAGIFVSIDKAERTVLEHVMDSVFGQDNRIEELIWSMNTNNSQAPNYSTNHEYVEVYAKNRTAAEKDPAMFREPKPGFEEVMALVGQLNPHYPATSQIESELRKLYDRHKITYREEIEAQGLEFEDEKNNDPWKGLYNYSHAEYRDAAGELVPETEAKARNANIWIWQEDNTSMPATKQSPTTRDESHRNWRFYRPPHPVTGRLCPHPKSGWKFAYDDDEDSPDKKSFVALDRDGRIAWGLDENKVPRLKRMLHEVETNVGKSVFQDYSDGEKQTSAMFGQSGLFLAPKHADFVSRFVLHAAKKDSIVLDCFGGSGSSGHAVIRLNREDKGNRKFVLVEVGNYFKTVLKPRILKAVYSNDWRGGKPLSREGLSCCIKVLRLESYEDALNNLELRRSPAQDELLAKHQELREDYLLRYQLDVESLESASLLNLPAFACPFAYQLKIACGSVGESRPVNVDLVETFNFLLGLRVSHMDTIRGFRVVTGLSPAGEKVLVIWRNLAEKSNAALDEFFQKQRYNTKDMEFAIIYVNGDNNLENLKRADETWKVRRVEDEFKRLMFDVQDI